MEHRTFSYQTLDELREEAERVNAFIPVSEDLSVLTGPLRVAGKTVRNRFVIQPMEGCDGTYDGAPGELTVRRYMRFAAGGAGLIWFEATAILPEGRANARQLMITEKNLDDFKRLLENIRETSVRENGFEPVLIMQATHSGRYAKPWGKPEPLIACRNPFYEKDSPLDESRIVSDEYLDSLPERYAKSARLAEAAGFDGVDIKACHRYLISELLSARTRENSRYGGSFENRTKLLFDAVDAVHAAVSRDMIVTTRLNVYDGVEFPYGFGTAAGLIPDLSEPLMLVKELSRLGLKLLNVTAGNPYVNPHVNRPFDKGPYTLSEHPLQGLGRMYSCVRAVKEANPGMICVASGLSYTRQFSANAAAGLLACNAADLAGFGREAFAYPDFARDITQNGAMEKSKCCLSCGKCSELMRVSTAGCAVRDEMYTRIYEREIRA